MNHRVSIKAILCPNNGCDNGLITVYNAYELGPAGLPVGKKQKCDVCESKGYIVSDISVDGISSTH